MGRPRTPVGQSGRITSVKGADGWVARAWFRDGDGRSRRVTARASSRARAETLLRTKLQDRQHVAASGRMRADMAVSGAARVWLGQLSGADLSAATRRLYAGHVGRYVEGSQIAALTLTEVNNAGVIEAWLQAVADNHGTGAAKGARSVLSGTLGLAVRWGVLPYNAIRDARTPKPTVVKQLTRDPDRAFTKAERDHVLTVAETNPVAVRHDLADLLWFLDGTGVRISEALNVRWDDLNLDAGTVHVEGTKTEFAVRDLHMPARLTRRLSDRLHTLKSTDCLNGVVGLAGRGVVFHSPGTADREKPRNRDNTIKHIRRILDAAGMPWATSHTFRHAVITRIVEAGQDVGRAADQAGHSDLRTTQAYIGRKRDTSALRDVL